MPKEHTIYIVILNERSIEQRIVLHPVNSLVISDCDILNTVSGDCYIGDDGGVYDIGKVTRVSRFDGTSFLVFVTYDEYDAKLVEESWSYAGLLSSNLLLRDREFCLTPSEN